MRVRKAIFSLVFGLGMVGAWVAWPSQARGEAMLQLFNVSWAELIEKMPELAEAGYTSLWLPPPTKGSGVYSVGYDLFDPFDLGDKDQRGTIRTRYGTKEELLRMVETAHRFGLRVYFDNIMNHRAFDVPGYDENTPITLYPGMLPEDFHLRVTPEGFFRKWDNTRDWNSVWQVQNLGLADLIDISQENPNANFGPTEGTSGNPKLVFVRQPNNPEYYMDQGLPPIAGPWRPFNGANGDPVAEDVNSYFIRAAMWLIHETKADGLRLDAVKHVPAYFFGDYLSATPHGYTGAIQTMFDYVHGYGNNVLGNGYVEPDDNRNSCFDAEAVRNDALLFGEHLGEPPSYDEYLKRGMRLVDNPLRNYLNDVLGNPGRTLAGLDQRDFGGFSAFDRVMHAQSHDNDYAVRRELHNAYYFMREGMANIYSDGYNKSQTCRDCGGAFPRHANAPYLGQFGDNKMPDLMWLHGNLARGGTRPRWSDSDIVAFERYDYREPGSAADQTVALFIMNDRFDSPDPNGDISFDDGAAQQTAGTFYECFPVSNSRGVGLAVSFPPGSVLVQLADSPGKSRACSKLLVRKATSSLAAAQASINAANPVDRLVYVGGQTIPPGGGAIEVKIPRGSYVIYAYEPPGASRPIGGVLSNTVVMLVQDGKEVPRMTVRRTDGVDGDTNFNPIYPFKMRGSVDVNGNVIGGSNVSNLTYAIDIPVITNNTPIDIVVRTDGSATNVLVKLDGGMDVNSQMGLGPTSGFDKRDNKPGSAYDMFLGYEQTAFQLLNGPEKFAARDVARNTVTSSGAETYHYTIGGGDAVVNGAGGGATIDTETADWVFHNPPAAVDGIANTKHREPNLPGAGQSVTNWVKVGYQFRINKGHIYYTTDGSNPEGAFGIGAGSTQVVPLQFSHTTTQADGVIDWWRGIIPGQPAGTTVKYKIALYKQGANTISDADPAKYYAMRQSAVTNFNPQTAVVWLHNNLNTNHTAVGLEEGFHIVRARPFLPRDGKSSVYNTFMQTFYYDPAPPTGVIAFPQNNGDTMFSQQYGVVVRADATVTEVEFNIIDADPSNDNPANGNGLTNGLPAFAKAYAVSPLPSLSQQYPNYPKEFRFNYVGIPSSGTATITVRLKELTTATFTNRFTELVRTVHCAAPALVLNIRCPDSDCFGSDQRNIFLDQNDKYTIVTCFSNSLQSNIDRFTIKINGAIQARRKPDGTPLYYINDVACASGTRALRLDWGGMSAGQHLIEVFYDDAPGGIHLQDSAFVNVTLTGISVNIINPPEADAAGRSPFTIVLPDKTNATPAERSFTITTETSMSVTNVSIGFNIITNAFTGGTAVLDTNFAGTTLRWDFLWTNMVQGTFVIRADALGGGSNTAFRTVNVVFNQIVPSNPHDDDDDDDGLNDLGESNQEPLPSTNPESWTNGEVHRYFFTGKSDPLNPDSDNDGLPDALELGLSSSIATNTNLSADTNGDGWPNFIADTHPPIYNTFDNSGVPGFDPNKPRTDLIRGTLTDPGNPDTDFDGLKDSLEDSNRNGRVDIALTNATGAVTNYIASPPTVRATSRIDRDAVQAGWPNSKWTETDPNNDDTDGDGLKDGIEDADHDGKINGDTNNDRVWQPGELWTETDPLSRDTDGDGLPDGWEVQYELDPLDNGTLNMRTGSSGNPIHGASGDPDGDGFTNLQEFINGTNPREDDTLPPPPLTNPITIGPGPVIGSAAGVTWNQEFQDWTLDDVKALDEYDGGGFLKRGRDVYPHNNGFDWDRDIIAFYARDGGPTGSGGDGKFHMRVDFHDLKANAMQSEVDVYVVIDTGNTAQGEAALPGEIDAKTDMKWEVVVAVYNGNNGQVFVDLNPIANTTGINQDLVTVGGVQVRGYTPGGNGFLGSYDRGDLDALEFSISRQALIDAGWNGNPNNLNFQVFTTRDGTQNNPLGAGDIGGRADITDSIMDDDIAESDTQAPRDTLTQWFSYTNKPNAAKLAVVLHGNQAILPASLIHNLISNATVRTPTGTFPPLDPGNQPTGYYRALETHETFKLPLDLHLSGSLISALQWAKTDPARDPTGSRDGVKFNQRIRTLIQSNKVALISGMFADHIAPYFTGPVNRAAIQLQNDIMRSVYGSNSVTAATPLWLAERVVDGPTLSDLSANSGHTYLILDQMVHLWWWGEQLFGFGNGRTTALGNGGYQINQFNGMKAFLISGASDQMYLNNDLGATISLRQLFLRKAMSGIRDQVVILGDNWETAGGIGGNSNPDKWNLSARWIANHPWIQPVTLAQIVNGQIDLNRDGILPDWWWVHNRNQGFSDPYPFNQQSKDLIRHNSRTNYNHWYYGLAGAEESFFHKFPPLRSGVFGSKRLGHVLTNGTVLADAWFDAQAASGTLSNLARLVYLNGIFQTAFHDEDNNNFERFSTGDYKYPDTTGFDTLSAFAAKPNSRATRQASIVAQAYLFWFNNPSATATNFTQDVDHDGEVEYILANSRIYAVFERIGGRMIAAFARDAVSGNAYQVVGNLVSTPEYETELEGESNLSGTDPLAYRTSGFKDWFAQTGGPGVGTNQYVNDLYTAAPAPSGTGWQFTSSDSKIIKTIRLSGHDNKLEASYTIGGGINKLFTRHGLSPDLLNLLFQGQAGLQGPTSAGGKVSLINSNATAVTSVSLNFADAGHSNVTYNATATDRHSSFSTINMRNQAQTHQIELESTATSFNFALEMNAADCTADPDTDGLNNCQEAALGTIPTNPDTDNDGMNDGWEAQYRNPLVPQDGAVDPDGDGMTDLQESIAGTNPDNSTSSLRIISITPVSGGYQIVWTSVPGKNYQLWTTTDLTSPFTCIAGCPTIPSAGAETTYTHSTGTDARRYYKVKVLAP